MTKNYLIRGSNSEKTIYLRIREGIDVDIKVSTGLKVDEKHWDKKKGWPKESIGELDYNKLDKSLQQKLNSVRAFEFGPGNNTTINRNWLHQAISFNVESVEESKILLKNQLTNYKEKLNNRPLKGRSAVAPGTLRNFNTTISRIKKYESHFEIELFLSSLNFQFYDEYLLFAQKNLSLSLNSIGKDIKNIKAVCSDAKDRGMEVNENVFSRRFSAPIEKSSFVTITPLELEKLSKFKGANYLENARDWLIIGCWTGCRFNDLISLNKSNLIDYKDSKIIRYEQSKTQKVVRLALHPQVISILSHRDWEFPRPISNVKFNEYIKKLSKEIGMDELSEGIVYDEELKKRIKGMYPKWKLIKSHTCRRTFATNHYGKLPTSKLIAATGHSTEKMLLAYIGETEESHLDDFIDIWKN